MDFTAETYRNASLEHLRRAQTFHAQEQYFLAHYFSGVAVECLLRAYLLRISPEFDSRHDLYELARSARFFEIVPSELRKEYGTKFTTLNLRWRSNHRYATEKQWRDFLSGLKADFNMKGDRAKNNSRTLLNIAYHIVNLGDRNWTLKNE